MDFWGEILCLDSSFHSLSIHTWIKESSLKKLILMIGLFYSSLHSSPTNPLIKVFIFSLLPFFGSLLVTSYWNERERRSRANEEYCLMLNLVMEKWASTDCNRVDRASSSPRRAIGLVQRSKLNFGLWKSPYIVDMCFTFPFNFLFLHLRVHLSFSPSLCINPLLPLSILLILSSHHIHFISFNDILSYLF